MYCELVDTGKMFKNKKVYTCNYCKIELALENSDTKILCFKRRADVQRSIIAQSLEKNPIYTGIDYGPDNDMAQDIEMLMKNIAKQNNETEVADSQQEKTKEELCTKQQIDTRLEICNKCEYYQADACILCGCRIVREKNYQNKLANKNAECPAGKWGPILD